MTGRILPGEATPSVAFLARPRQTSPAFWYIRQAATSVASKRSVAMPAPAESPRQGDAVVERGADGRVASGTVVVLAPGHEELAAAGAVGGVPAAAHPLQGQEAEQHEVDERDQQALQERDRLLAREAARRGPRRSTPGTRSSAPGRPARGGRRRPRRPAGMPAPGGEHVAGVLLAAPAGRQRRARSPAGRAGPARRSPARSPRSGPPSGRRARSLPGPPPRSPGPRTPPSRIERSSFRAGIRTETAGRDSRRARAAERRGAGCGGRPGRGSGRRSWPATSQIVMAFTPMSEARSARRGPAP